jgi:hypothetical protein
MKTVLTTVLAFAALGIFAAEIPKAPVPPSPYLPIIYRFADGMLERGRDMNGLFYSALDRATLAPLTNHPPAPAGIREEDRALRSANPQHDQNFLRLLYILSELSGKPKYRDAADAELRWFVENADRHIHSSRRPWMLWERCFEVAPQASEKLARALAENPRNDPRGAGFDIRGWAVAYDRTKDEKFLSAIARSIAPFERNPDSNAISMLSLAIDCDAAARLLPQSLAAKLRALAERTDDTFCSLPHFLGNNAGFVIRKEPVRLVPREPPSDPRWTHGNTIAQVGMICVARYENTADVRYRDLIHRAADVYPDSPDQNAGKARDRDFIRQATDLYLDLLPPHAADTWAATFGHAISLQLAAWRSTAHPAYLDRARAFADFAVQHFFDQGPLPRGSLKTSHYESITGADTLALALVELHLHILHITAVRWQSNTIDR